MAITGAFKADFNDFVRGTAQADQAMEQMVGTSIALQSKLVLAEAGARAAGRAERDMADAIIASGTASEAQAAALVSLSTKHLEMKGNVGLVKDELREMTAGTRDAVGPTNTLRGSLSQFDGVLAAMGIHLGPEIRALGELGDISGKTASQLGLLATAGLAVGAGLGGWKIGRMIADFTGSDQIIGDLIGKLSGFQAGVAEAAVVTDALALASSRSHRTITDMSEAIQINTKWAADWSLVHGRSKDAVRETELAVLGWRTEIDRVASDGNLTQLTADMASQNFTLDALSKKYGIHVEALQFFSREQKAAAEITKEAAEVAKKAAKEESDALTQMGKAMRDAQAEIFRAMEEISAKIAKETDTQTKLILDEVAALNVLANKRQAEMFGAPARDFAGELQAELDRFERNRGALGDDLTNMGQAGAIAAEQRRQAAADATAFGAQASAGTRPTGTGATVVSPFAPSGAMPFSGGGVFGGGGVSMAGRPGDTFWTMPPSSISGLGGSQLMSGPSSGPTININITQPLGTPDAIATAVRDAIESYWKSQGYRFQ